MLFVIGFIGCYIFARTDSSNQEFAKPPEKSTPIAEFNHGTTIRAVAFSPVDTTLFVSAGEDKTIKLWSRNNTETPQIILRGHTETINSIAFSPTGELLASGGRDGIILWDVRSGMKIDSLGVPVLAVAIAPDGRYLAGAGVGVRLWDIRNPREITRMKSFPRNESASERDWVWTVDFSPDGKWLAYGDESGNLKVWDIQRQELVQYQKADSERILSVQFSADNAFLASVGRYRHTLWTLPKGQPYGKVIGEGIGLDFAFSPDDEMYALPDYNGVVLCSVKNGERIASLKGPTGTTLPIAFSPDGGALIGGSEDGILRLWDVSKRQLSKIDVSEYGVVRLIYFLSKEGPVRRGISTKLDELIKQVQHFYATQMESHGFGRKTFTFETGRHSRAKVHLVVAKHPDDYYCEDTIEKIRAEVSEHFDDSKNVLLVAVDIKNGVFHEKRNGPTGVGSITPSMYNKELCKARHGGRAYVSATNRDLDWETIAHELGHAFGLHHDFRHRKLGRFKHPSDPVIMSYRKWRRKVSKSTAEWLDRSRFFNLRQPFFDNPATIEISSLPNSSTPIPLQFEVTDEDGLHQVQFIVPTTVKDPAIKQGFKFHSYHSLNGEKKATIAFELTDTSTKEVALWMMDLHGNIVWRRFNLNEEREKLMKTLSCIY